MGSSSLLEGGAPGVERGVSTACRVVRLRARAPLHRERVAREQRSVRCGARLPPWLRRERAHRLVRIVSVYLYIYIISTSLILPAGRARKGTRKRIFTF